MAGLAAGIGIGGFGVHALQAQTKPPVYMIEDNTVNEPEGFAKEFAPVCTKNLNPGIVVMESAEDGERFDASSQLNRTRDRRIFVQ